MARLIVAKQGMEYMARDPLGDGKTLVAVSKLGPQIREMRMLEAKTQEGQ